MLTTTCRLMLIAIMMAASTTLCFGQSDDNARPTATVDTLIVPSAYLTTPMKVSVAHPQLEEGRTYPVVYMLNGYGGGYKDWVELAPRCKELAEQFGMILVCPDGRDSWYFDAPADSTLRMESFITKRLVQYVDSVYPTKAEPAYRAITGLSMGGHGAMWLGLRHPDIWGNIGSMSGGLNIEPFPKNWKIAKRLGSYDDNKDLWRSHTVINILPEAPTGQNIIIDCGVDDFFADVNRDVHKKLVENKIPHDFTMRPGKHNWPYWRNSILYHLTFFNEAFAPYSVKP